MAPPLVSGSFGRLVSPRFQASALSCTDSTGPQLAQPWTASGLPLATDSITHPLGNDNKFPRILIPFPMFRTYLGAKSE